MVIRFLTLVIAFFSSPVFSSPSWAQVPTEFPVQAPTSNNRPDPQQLKSRLSQIPKLEGVQFVNDSRFQILLEKDGKQYLIDTQNKTIHEIVAQASDQGQVASNDARNNQPAKGSDEAASEAKKEKEVYYTEDIVLWTLPTTHHLEKKALIIDFAHRFAYDDGTPFKGQVLNNLFGLDSYSFSSFGFTYGITDTFFAGIYRLPTGLGRIIQLTGGAQLSQEAKGHPFSSTFRVAIEGANHFRTNYVTSLEFAIAKSLKKRAQLYFVPTISFNNRPLTAPFGPVPKIEGETTTALGGGLSIDFRPTVAFVAEVNQRVSGLLGAHRPSFMLGVQKKLYRHSFTLGLSNSPGTSVSQRSGTRASLAGIENDTFSASGITIGFNLSRRLF